MANITKVQLRERVAKHLKVKARDIELDAAVAADIDETIDDARAFLQEKRLCWWGADAIPQACALPLTIFVGAWACTKVGKAGQGYEAGASEGRSLLAQLRPSADISTVTTDPF